MLKTSIKKIFVILLSLLLLHNPSVSAQVGTIPIKEMKFGLIEYDSSISTNENWNWQTKIINAGNPLLSQIGLQDYVRSTQGDRVVTTKILHIDEVNNEISGTNQINGQLTSGVAEIERSFFDPKYVSETSNGWLNDSQSKSLAGVNFKQSNPFSLKYTPQQTMVVPISNVEKLGLFETSLGNAIWKNLNPLTVQQMYSEAPNSPLTVTGREYDYTVYPENRWQNIYLGLVGLIPSNGELTMPPIAIRTFLVKNINANTELGLLLRTTDTVDDTLRINNKDHAISYSKVTSSFQLLNKDTLTLEVPFPNFLSLINPGDYRQSFQVDYKINTTLQSSTMYHPETGILLGSSGSFNTLFDIKIGANNLALSLGQRVDITLALQIMMKMEFTNLISGTNLAYGGVKTGPIGNDYFDVGDILSYILHSESNLSHEFTIGEGLNRNYFHKGYQDEENGFWDVEFYTAIPETSANSINLRGQTTFANSKGVTHKSSSGSAAVFPDVCRTPSPIIGATPIPYPSSGSSSGQKGVKTKKEEVFKSNSSYEMYKPNKTSVSIDIKELPGYQYLGLKINEFSRYNKLVAPFVGTTITYGEVDWKINGKKGTSKSVNITHEYAVIINPTRKFVNSFQESGITPSAIQYKEISWIYTETYIYDAISAVLITVIEKSELHFTNSDSTISLDQTSNPITSNIVYLKLLELNLQTHPKKYIDTLILPSSVEESSPSNLPLFQIFGLPVVMGLLVVTIIYHNKRE